MITRLILLASIVVMCAGCATTTAKIGNEIQQGAGAEEGGFKQKTEFKDLPVELQQVILGGGGGE